ncbi:MAG: hypothetical protein IK085_00260 [Clostridia bacterium]|nr:hypothetical protein [Clostridia bacterium]
MKKTVSFLLAIIVFSSTVFTAAAVDCNKKISLNSYSIIYEKGGVAYHYEDERRNEVNPFEKDYYKNTSRKAAGSSLPASYDSRDFGIVTPVKDQGNLGICWVTSSVSVLETNAVKRGLTDIDSARFSQSHFVWTAFEPSGIETDVNKDEFIRTYGNYTPYSNGGYDIYVANSLAKGCGVVDESDFPLNIGNPVDITTYNSEDYYKNNGIVIDEFTYLNSGNQVKEWIVENGSAQVSYYSNTNLYYTSSDENGNPYTAYYSGKTDGYDNHTVCIVGWDDGFSKDYFSKKPASDGAWLVKGSWGEAFATQGYYWLSYCEPTLKDFCGFTVRQIDYDFLYTYNGAPYNKLYFNSENPSVVKYANIYKTDSDEKLSEIGLFIENSNALVNVKVYEISDYTQPENGSVILEENTYVTDRGYHRIKTVSEPELSAEKYYSFVVTVTVREGSAYMPAESSEDYQNSQNTDRTDSIVYTSSTGQSFFFAENSQWVDMSDYGGNVYLNIYTDCTHKDAVIENQKEATCTTDGYSGDLHCSRCGKTVTGEVIQAGHKPCEPVFENSVDSTCSANGGVDKVVYCSLCGEKIITEHITFELLPHTDSDSDGQCDICKTVTDTEKHNLYLAKTAKVTVPDGRTVRYKYKVSMTASADLPDGYFIQWYSDGSPAGQKGNKKATYVTEPLTSQKYIFNAVIVDAKGNPVTSFSANSVTVTVDGSFISRMISVFARIFGLNTVNLNK